jgi:hypothetical protein
MWQRVHAHPVVRAARDEHKRAREGAQPRSLLEAFEASPHAIKMSRMPRCLRFVRTCSQNFGPSVC